MVDRLGAVRPEVLAFRHVNVAGTERRLRLVGIQDLECFQ